jgi:hypothetical protein
VSSNSQGSVGNITESIVNLSDAPQSMVDSAQLSFALPNPSFSSPTLTVRRTEPEEHVSHDDGVSRRPHSSHAGMSLSDANPDLSPFENVSQVIPSLRTAVQALNSVNEEDIVTESAQVEASRIPESDNTPHLIDPLSPKVEIHVVTPSLSPKPSAAPSRPPEPEPEYLHTYSCPICFGSPVNATLTPCGHILCGSCLFTAVGAAIQRTGIGGLGARLVFSFILGIFV